MVLPGGNGRMERCDRPHAPQLRPHPLSGDGHVGQRNTEGGDRRAQVARHPALRPSGLPAGLPVRHASARTAGNGRRILRQRQPGELSAALALSALRDRRQTPLRPETGAAAHPARRRALSHRAGGALPIEGGVFQLLSQGGEIPPRRAHGRIGDTRRRRRGARRAGISHRHHSGAGGAKTQCGRHLRQRETARLPQGDFARSGNLPAPRAAHRREGGGGGRLPAETEHPPALPDQERPAV